MATTNRSKPATPENALASSQLAGLLTVAVGGLLVALAMGGYLFR